MEHLSRSKPLVFLRIHHLTVIRQSMGSKPLLCITKKVLRSDMGSDYVPVPNRRAFDNRVITLQKDREQRRRFSSRRHPTEHWCSVSGDVHRGEPGQVAPQRCGEEPGWRQIDETKSTGSESVNLQTAVLRKFVVSTRRFEHEIK
jgi:hypothetical protein